MFVCVFRFKFCFDVVIIIVVFFVVLVVLIVVYEWGYYCVVCVCGVKVLCFFIGFGCVIWWCVGCDGIEFILSVLLLGGYVCMLDECDGLVVLQECEQVFGYCLLCQCVVIVVVGLVVNGVLVVLFFVVVVWFGSEVFKVLLGMLQVGLLVEVVGVYVGDWVCGVLFDGQQWDDIDLLMDL